MFKPKLWYIVKITLQNQSHILYHPETPMSARETQVDQGLISRLE